MADTVKSWIEERRAIHAGGRDVLLRSSYELERESGIEEGADIDAIVDAHNSLPRALNALEQVLAVCDKALAVTVEGSSEGDAAMAAMAATVKRAIEGAVSDE